MKRVLAAFIATAGLAIGALPAVAHEEGAKPAAAHPQVGSHVVFLYYKDVEAAARFYSDVIGLKKTFDEGWVKMFQITEYSYVGLVDETRGYHKAPAATPSVMLSMETTELEAWYKRLKAKNATFIKELDLDRPSPLVNAILLKDPGGYTVEFFRWKKK